MSNHLSNELFQRYRAGGLAVEELMAVDEHLSGCESCRSRAAHADDAGVADGLRADLRREAAIGEHLTHETAAAYVDNALAAPERETAERHLGLCRPCSERAAELLAFRAEMSTYAPRRFAPAQSGRESALQRIGGWFRAPVRLSVGGAFSAAAAAAALLLVVIVGTSPHGAGPAAGAGGARGQGVSINGPTAAPDSARELLGPARKEYESAERSVIAVKRPPRKLDGMPDKLEEGGPGPVLERPR